MAQCVQESGLQIPAIETEDCLCQIGRNMLGTDPLLRVCNVVEFQRRNRNFGRIPLVTIARKPYILIVIIDMLMLHNGYRVRIRAHRFTSIRVMPKSPDKKSALSRANTQTGSPFTETTEAEIVR